jgi:N-hydroxyarylamine O-acetyltransferase
MPTRRYLARLGIDAPLPPTLDTLFLLHERHQERVPYENLGIMLGRPPSVDPESCLDRVGRTGRAGYCLHHNAALELVLTNLGFTVERRHGHVWTDEQDRDGDALNHLVLVVTDLPTAGNPDGRWWVDVGLGDAFRLPLPLVAGAHVQDGFCYRLDDVRADGWSFRHDPAGSFTGVEVRDRAVGPFEVLAAHAELSAPEGGRFARFVVVQRRTAEGTATLRGRTLQRQTPRGTTTTELTSYDAWRAALADDLQVPLDDLDDAELVALFERSAR